MSGRNFNMSPEDYEERGAVASARDFDFGSEDGNDFDDVDLGLIRDEDDDRFDADIREVPPENFYTVHENSVVEPPEEKTKTRRAPPARNSIPSAGWFGVNLQRGIVVEFWTDSIPKEHRLQSDQQSIRDESVGGDFLLVTGTSASADPQKNGQFLRGFRFRRNRLFHSAFVRFPNEVCLVAKITQDDPRPFWIQGEIEIPIEDNIIQVRGLILTESEYPSLSIPQLHGRKTNTDSDPLICRYLWLHIFETSELKRSSKPREGVVRRITREDWRNIQSRLTGDVKPTKSKATVKGDFQPPESGLGDLRLDEHKVSPQKPLQAGQRGLTHRQRPTKPYIFGDIFCGAGGASRAAQRAGLRIKYGIDNEINACNAYKLNFPELPGSANPGPKVYHEDVQKVLAMDVDLKADIVHTSFPCQYFSAAHTTVGKNDDTNSAVIMCLGDMLEKIKPRLVTFEQAPGLFNRHHLYFFFVLGAFQSHGYSVAFKVVKFMDYGLAQKRERLILFAAAPGVPLPRFPDPTVGWGPGQPRPTTLHDALFRLPDWDTRPGDPLHEPRKTRRSDHIPFDRRIHRCLGCITTSGGLGNVHPCGKRTYTLREYARIQGFPDRHQFSGSRRDKLRQIGNAVPPQAFGSFFDECIQTLSDVDSKRLGAVRCSPYESGRWTGINADGIDTTGAEAYMSVGIEPHLPRRSNRWSLESGPRSRSRSSSLQSCTGEGSTYKRRRVLGDGSPREVIDLTLDD